MRAIAALRSRVHSAFGQVALAMMLLPRYRSLPIGDLQAYVLEPLLRDRIALASTQPPGEGTPGEMVGITIWASVSEEVDARIREQIKAGVFPVRLQPGDWTSGEINWLLDLIAPSQKLATSLLVNFKQLVKQGDVRIHPLVTRLVDPEVLKRAGATAARATR